MQDFAINVTEIEELQMTGNVHELDRIFLKARSVVIGGGTVALVRKPAHGKAFRFDEISTEDGLETYKKQVYKYL